MTVRELLARIDSTELTEWMAFEQYAGPLGGDRHDYHAAQISAVIANANRGRRRQRAFQVADFLPRWLKRRSQTEQGWEEQLAIVQGLAARGIGRITSGDDR